MNQSELKIWFPEPLVEDESFARKDEEWFDWVSRATSKKGKACRAFLNAQICKVPASWQSKLYQDFKTRVWDSVLFELIVARTMQILGASIEVEVPVAGTNKRPDFLARFPDSLITVEATVPEINEPMNRQLARNEDLIEIIERLIPEDWSVRIWRLPRIGANDSKQALKKRMEEVLARLPSAQDFPDKY